MSAATPRGASGGSRTPPVWALVRCAGRLDVGGDFTSIGGKARNSIAALDASTGLATDWNPNPTAPFGDAIVMALAVSGSNVYLGGNFTAVGGQPRHHLPRVDVGTVCRLASGPCAAQ